MAQKFVEVGLIPMDADLLASDEILKADCKFYGLGLGVWGQGLGFIEFSPWSFLFFVKERNACKRLS